MCGLFGFKTSGEANLSDKQRNIRLRAVTALGIAMEDRGDHSTGVAAINSKGLQLHKLAITPSVFLRQPEFRRLAREADTLIGHTRFATIGAKTDRNAHPFHDGNIVGAHNGHVSNHLTVNKKDAEVDSEAIFHLLNETDDDAAAAFKQLTGTFAVAWMDLRKPHVLRVVRHTNPFYYFFSKRLKTMFWASEPVPLRMVQASIIDEDEQIFYPPEDEVYSFGARLDVVGEKVEFKSYVYVAPKSTTAYPQESFRSYYDRTADADFEDAAPLVEVDEKKKAKTDIVISNANLEEIDFSTQKCIRCQDDIYVNCEDHFLSEYAQYWCRACGQVCEEAGHIKLYPVYIESIHNNPL